MCVRRPLEPGARPQRGCGGGCARALAVYAPPGLQPQNAPPCKTSYPASASNGANAARVNRCQQAPMASNPIRIWAAGQQPRATSYCAAQCFSISTRQDLLLSSLCPQRAFVSDFLVSRCQLSRLASHAAIVLTHLVLQIRSERSDNTRDPKAMGNVNSARKEARVLGPDTVHQKHYCRNTVLWPT